MAREKTTAALFDSFENATEAVRRLNLADIEPLEISIIAHNQGSRYSKYVTGSHGQNEEGNDTTVGAVLGGILGAGAGLLTGLSLIAIPGIGPAIGAGWLIAGLVGAGAITGAAGALAATLASTGITAEEAERYAEGMRRGGTLLVVRTFEENIERIIEILDEAGAIDMDGRIEVWRLEKAAKTT
jgi:hypothetical protein